MASPPPYQLPPPAPPVGSRRNGVGCLVGGVAAGCGLSTLLGAAAIVGVVVFAMQVFTEQVRTELADNAVVLEHLGHLERLELRWAATAAEPDAEIFVFDARGTTGRAVVVAECVTVSEEREEVRSGYLRLPSGERVDLFPALETAPETEAQDVELASDG